MSDDVKPKKGRGRPATGLMPNQRLTCPNDLWQAMRAAAAGQGTTLSAETRAFYAWYTGQHGATLPERPGGQALSQQEGTDSRAYL